MKILPSPPLVSSSMEGGNLTGSNILANPAAAGSQPITPMPDFNNSTEAALPLPKLPAQLPVHMQAGKHGAAGLPSAPPQPPEDSADGPPWPAGDQGLTGSLSPWKKTPGF